MIDRRVDKVTFFWLNITLNYFVNFTDDIRHRHNIGMS